jgi:hypothetical protein
VSPLVTATDDDPEAFPRPAPSPSFVAGLAVPAAIAVLVIAIVLAWIVRSSESAWHLLAAGRGLVEPERYPVTGFVIVLATALGQAAGWAGGSAAVYHVLTALGMAAGFTTWRIAMSLVYLGLGTLPLFFFHVVYGQPLLGLRRTGLADWVLVRFPDAHWLLFRAHPYVDGALVPLGIAFLGLLWLTGDTPRRSRSLQTALALALLGTSLSVALSLAIHSTLVHVKLIE